MNNGLLNGINITKIVDNLNKILNTANKVLPLYDKIKPIINNAPAISSILNSFDNINIKEKTSENKKVSNNLPTFFQ